jgi:hypothetical protein
MTTQPAATLPAQQTSPNLAVTPQSTATVSPPPVTTPPVTTPPPTTTRPTTTRPTPNRPRSQPPAQQPVTQPVVQPPPVEEGYLTIDSDPPGEVFIDGVDVGSTPVYKRAVKPGQHTIRIEAPGYKTVTQRVQVDPGNTVPKRLTLIPE